MSDYWIKKYVVDAFKELEVTGNTFTKAGLVEQLVRRDERVLPGYEEIFYSAYRDEISKQWSNRATLSELFGVGSVPEEHASRTMARFYAINSQNERRATRHMSTDELDYVASFHDSSARSSTRDAETTRIARSVVQSKRDRF